MSMTLPDDYSERVYDAGSLYDPVMKSFEGTFEHGVLKKGTVVKQMTRDYSSSDQQPGDYPGGRGGP